AKFAKCCPMRVGLGLGGGDLGLTVGNPGGTAIAVIDRNHFLDTVQLNRRTEIVPERLMPVLKGRSDDADGRTRDDKLAVFTGQISPSKIFPHGLLYARIDASQHHGFVIAFGCNHKGSRQCDRETRAGYLHEPATIERASQLSTAASARNPMSNEPCLGHLLLLIMRSSQQPLLHVARAELQ